MFFMRYHFVQNFGAEGSHPWCFIGHGSWNVSTWNVDQSKSRFREVVKNAYIGLISTSRDSQVAGVRGL